MKKLTIRTVMIAALCAVCNAFAAIPSAEEIKAAAPKIEELTRNDYAALKAKKKTNVELGDVLVDYIVSGDKSATTYLLQQKAFQQYILGLAFDKADVVYSCAISLNGIEYALEVVRPTRSKLSGLATSKRPAAKALKDRIASDERAMQEVRLIKAKLKKDPGDEKLCEQLGFAYIVCGDWESALAAFQTAPGELPKIADWELSETKSKDYNAAKIAAFWWSIAEENSKNKSFERRVKAHAARWYVMALDSNQIEGVDAKIAEKRIEEAGRGMNGKGGESSYTSALPFIESNGHQWIDTGIIPNSQTKIELLDFCVTSWTCAWCEFCGSASGDETSDCFEFRRSCERNCAGIRIGNPSGNLYLNYAFEIKEKRRYASISFDKNGIKGNGLKAELIDNRINKELDGKYSIYVFASNQSGRAFRPSSIRIGGLKIWQGKKLVRDMIPVVSEGSICMFDKVTCKIFKNAGDQPFAVVRSK